MVIGGTMTIRMLIADDQALTRLGVRAILEDARDIEIVGEAGSGDEALAMAQDLHPDVVLMDVRMPPGDGIEATRKIRERCPETQVLILTGHGDSRFLQRAATAGAVGFVLKDISSADLASAIRSVHQGKTTIGSDVARQLMDELAAAGTVGDPARRRPYGLTDREVQVLAQVARGLGDKEIAAKLCLSESTVKSHLRAVYRRLGLRNRAQAAAFAIERNLVDDQT